jgi:hypothetical protein
MSKYDPQCPYCHELRELARHMEANRDRYKARWLATKPPATTLPAPIETAAGDPSTGQERGIRNATIRWTDGRVAHADNEGYLIYE